MLKIASHLSNISSIMLPLKSLPNKVLCPHQPSLWIFSPLISSRISLLNLSHIVINYSQILIFNPYTYFFYFRFITCFNCCKLYPFFYKSSHSPSYSIYSMPSSCNLKNPNETYALLPECKLLVVYYSVLQYIFFLILDRSLLISLHSIAITPLCSITALSSDFLLKVKVHRPGC